MRSSSLGIVVAFGVLVGFVSLSLAEDDGHENDQRSHGRGQGLPGDVVVMRCSSLEELTSFVVTAVSSTSGAPRIQPGRESGDDCASALASLINGRDPRRRPFKILHAEVDDHGDIIYTLAN